MNFFKMEGNGFIICLGILLLLTGLIMIYVKQRFAVYDRLISEQNKLLKHVVSNIENISSQHFQSARDLSNPMAVAAAVEAVKTVKQLNLTTPIDVCEEKCEKIVVSDDEDSSDSDEEDEDEGDDDVDEEDEDVDDDSSDSDESSETMSESEAVTKLSNQTKVLKIDNFNFNVIKHLKDSDSDSESTSSDDSDSTDSVDTDSSEDNELVKRKNETSFGIKVVELGVPLEDVNTSDFENLGIESVVENHTEETTDVKNIFSEVDKLDIDDVTHDMSLSISKNVDLEDNLTVNSLSLLKKHELEAMCREKKLNSKGTRMELIKRLANKKE